ncbi:hypothetical protein JKF63_06325 [Porcisia hertigi]|uniref:Uncharacterized protein n=1 Tax=Porcisia hertigi TaxID=2761500 RepID=A0A836IYV5_9TRYP|nr:hypothetical protein JKF63_06325 [Porcisia hertigi]
MLAGNGVVGTGSGSQAQQATSLFLRDVKHLLRWHAVATSVALAATPVVYQVVRIVAHRYRAELVNLAKNAVQREELFRGEEEDGVLIDPPEQGGMSVSYSGAERISREVERGASPVAAAAASGGVEGSDYRTKTSPPSFQPSASTFALGVGRRHAWAVSSFAREVLAAQRAPNVQFVRTCSWSAVRQYNVVVLRAATTSCLVSVATFTVLYAGCRALDHAVPFGTSPAAAAAKDMAPRSLLKAFVTEPLFMTVAPPTPAVNSTYGLYCFSVSAAGVWSRLFPLFGAVQTLWQCLTGCTQSLHAEWRGGSITPSSSSSSHALADSVWASLSPRGYFIVSLLPRLPPRIAAGLLWVGRRTFTAVVRRWYTASWFASRAPRVGAPAATGAAVSPSESTCASTVAAGGGALNNSTLSQRRRRRKSAGGRVHSLLAKVLALAVGDVAFAGLVFLATSYASGIPSTSSSWVSLGLNTTTQYTVYCWSEAICSALRMVSLL